MTTDQKHEEKRIRREYEQLGAVYDPSSIHELESQLAYDEVNMRSKVPSTRQIRYARRLGLKFDPSSVSKKALSDLIDEELDRRILVGFEKKGLHEGSEFNHRTHGVCTIKRIDTDSLEVTFFSHDKGQNITNTMKYLFWACID